jgi:hypothetical protein
MLYVYNISWSKFHICSYSTSSAYVIRHMRHITTLHSIFLKIKVIEVCMYEYVLNICHRNELHGLLTQ